MTKTKGEAWLDVGLFGWLVRYEYTDTWLDFLAYEAIGESGNNGHDDDGAKLFRRKGEARGDGVTTTPEEAVALGGFVKWDGCCEFTWPDEKPHFCGREDVAAFAKVLTELHALCLMLPHVDRECAGYAAATNDKTPAPP